MTVVCNTLHGKVDIAVLKLKPSKTSAVRGCVCVFMHARVYVSVVYAKLIMTCFAASLGRMNMEAEDSIATMDSIFEEVNRVD